MMSEFERFVGIDWSGAGGEDDRVALRVVTATVDESPEAVRPPTSRRAKNWKRSEVRQFLGDALGADEPPTIVGIDAALGYPAGADEEVFGVTGWRSLAREVASVLDETGGVRPFMDTINARHAQRRGVPFFCRHSDISDRNWWREHQVRHGFFTETGVAYYRLVDALIPEAISAFYMGPGAMVGGHTITCLKTLDALMDRRENTGEMDFGVWPHEPDWRERKHVIAECYPAMYPGVVGTTKGKSRDHLDAVKIASWLRQSSPKKLRKLLNFAASCDDGLQQLVAQEGWVLGVEAPAKGPQLIAALTD